MVAGWHRGGGMRGGAEFSACGRYRYALWRRWAPGPRLGVVMLNPSRADARRGDATVTRCIGRARAAGYGAMTVVNLFALVDRDPAGLRGAADPVGPANDAVIARELGRLEDVLCAWGNHGARAGRSAQVAARLRAGGWRLFALGLGTRGLTARGEPRHPLMLPAGCGMEVWR